MRHIRSPAVLRLVPAVARQHYPQPPVWLASAMFLDRELLHPRSPATVRQWAATLPAWAGVRSPRDASRCTEIGPGEREAIALAMEKERRLPPH